MRIARVLVTWDCLRDCDLCCNKNLPVELRSCRLSDLRDYDQVLLTGGEPMLYPEKLQEIIRELRSRTPVTKQKIYLYTALYVPALEQLVNLVDGVHFTLHHPLRPGDLDGFRRFQNVIGRYRGTYKTFRLYVEPRISDPVAIIPDRWARVEVKPWMMECPLPEGEELFYLR